MSHQVLRANPALVTATFLNTLGIVVDPGTVLVTVTRLDGTAVVSGVPTTSGTGANARNYLLTATHTALLDTLTVTFASASLSQDVAISVEVVGAFLFSETEARAFDAAAMSDETSYSDAAIQRMRARITDEFESITGIGFVPRYRRDAFVGADDARMPRSVETYSNGVWTAYSVDDLADVLVEYDALRRRARGVFPMGYANVRVGYEYGMSPTPFDISEAALWALRYYLVPTNVDPRALSISNDIGTTNLWTPGVSGRGEAIHAMPETDRILKLYRSTVGVY
jgi:hypothetical protein